MKNAVLKSYEQAHLFVDSLEFTEPLEITVKAYDHKRTGQQNRLINAVYNEVDKVLSRPVGATRCECKLFFGVPILRAENDSFRDGYDRLIKRRMTKDEKLELMRWFPVTSLMSKKQLSRYMETIYYYYAENYHLVLE